MATRKYTADDDEPPVEAIKQREDDSGEQEDNAEGWDGEISDDIYNDGIDSQDDVANEDDDDDDHATNDINQSHGKRIASRESMEATTVKEKDSTIRKQRKIHKLSLTATEDFNEKLRKRGVLYIARIPPRMTPTKIKSLLSEFGVVTRVYLMEEDATVRKRRRKVGGSGSKRYVEGWVEMEDKNVAKRIASSLNNTPITNYKRSAHYGDLWNLKYLHRFKWSHLTEKVAYERRVREQKLRVEMMQARRENAAYSQLVETGQKIDKIEARLERKRQRSEPASKPGPLNHGKNRLASIDAVDVVLGDRSSTRTHVQAKPMNEGAGKVAKHAVLRSLL